MLQDKGSEDKKKRISEWLLTFLSKIGLGLH